jgi:2-C-methyl-D-erythritol 4-phosphate cytidylyltransferase/2-C-methyl-D-erythritol 2,4-cyclodiphosphate synthase
VAAIVVAGGRGDRFGGGIPKQFLEVHGRSLLQRSVDAFLASPQVDEVVVVLPPAYVDRPREVLAFDQARVRVVAGGARRQDSVAAGFDAVSEACDVVLVHDAARPFVSEDLIARAVAAAGAHGAAVVALPARDTIKRSETWHGATRIAETLPRERIHLAQTPQAFRRDVLAEAIALGRSGIEATDEAALAEAAGRPVVLVDGDPHNIKVTTQADVPVASAIARLRDLVAPHVDHEGLGGLRARGVGTSGQLRVGIGYDSHRFGEGRSLVLGGVWIPHEQGLVGHSDADAVSHAVTDAILGAASLGDIGGLFPDTDPRWKDADSLLMLAAAVERLHDAGFSVGNVDVVVICERPKIGPHAEAMRHSLARILAVAPAAVSVKGKTNEGVDATGRGEALAVHAVATVLFRGEPRRVPRNGPRLTRARG